MNAPPLIWTEPATSREATLSARAGSQARGLDLDKMAAREIVYGMPYSEYKAKHQEPADSAKQAAYEEAHKRFGH